MLWSDCASRPSPTKTAMADEAHYPCLSATSWLTFKTQWYDDMMNLKIGPETATVQFQLLYEEAKLPPPHVKERGEPKTFGMWPVKTVSVSRSCHEGVLIQTFCIQTLYVLVSFVLYECKSLKCWMNNGLIVKHKEMHCLQTYYSVLATPVLGFTILLSVSQKNTFEIHKYRKGLFNPLWKIGLIWLRRWRKVWREENERTRDVLDISAHLRAISALLTLACIKINSLIVTTVSVPNNPTGPNQKGLG